MRLSSAAKTLIIGALLVVLSACSMVRTGYDNGPALALWWLDGYLDLSDEQEDQARPLLRQWFAWHRSTQLPDYAGWLATWRARAGGEVSAEEVCRWTELTRERLWTAVEQALPAGARMLPSVTPAQWAYLERQLAERLAELRETHAQPSLDERRAAALDRAVERAESFYGEINAAQRRLLAEGLATSPRDAASWLDAREARQRDFVADLRRAQKEVDAARRQAALRHAAQRLMAPPDAAEAALQARWQSHGCAMTARLHATTTPAQRQHLRERLAAWEEDVRALAAAGAS